MGTRSQLLLGAAIGAALSAVIYFRFFAAPAVGGGKPSDE